MNGQGPAGRPRSLVLWLLAALFVGLGVVLAQSILATQPLGTDFMPMWAAARVGTHQPGLIYDFDAVTQVQRDVLPALRKVRPWAYPPSALLFLAVFGGVSFALANLVWTASTLALQAWASLRALAGVRALGLLLVLAAPASVLVAITGQTTFLIAATIALTVAILPGRPILAGALMGLCAATKPSALVLFPVALVACGAYSALAAAILAGLCCVLASTMLFGWTSWIDWLIALPRFQHLVQSDPSLLRGSITPTGLAMNAGLSGPRLAAWNVAFALLGAGIVWRAFRGKAGGDPARRLAALLGGGLLATPYAMHYDAALLVLPAVIVLMKPLPQRAWLVALLAYMLLACALIPYAGAAATTLAVLILSASGGEARETSRPIAR